MKYKVTKRFTSGLLSGITVEEETNVPFQIGEVIPRAPYTPSGYTVVSVEEVG